MGLSYEASLISFYAGVKERLRAPKVVAAPRIVLQPRQRAQSARLVVTACEEMVDISPPVDVAPEAPVEMATAMQVPLRWKIILREVASKYKISASDITSHRRDGATVLARHEFCYRMRHETDVTLPQIGRWIKRDHTTVLHGVRAHAARLNGDRYNPIKRVSSGRKPSPQWSAEKVMRAYDLRFNLGMTFREIADEIGGVTAAAVARRLDRLRAARMRARAEALELAK